MLYILIENKISGEVITETNVVQWDYNKEYKEYYITRYDHEMDMNYVKAYDGRFFDIKASGLYVEG